MLNCKLIFSYRSTNYGTLPGLKYSRNFVTIHLFYDTLFDKMYIYSIEIFIFYDSENYNNLQNNSIERRLKNFVNF